MKFYRKSNWLILGLILGLLTFLFPVESSIAKKSGGKSLSAIADVYLPIMVKYHGTLFCRPLQ